LKAAGLAIALRSIFVYMYKKKSGEGKEEKIIFNWTGKDWNYKIIFFL
jgi:hypothetical protein